MMQSSGCIFSPALTPDSPCLNLGVLESDKNGAVNSHQAGFCQSADDVEGMTENRRSEPIPRIILPTIISSFPLTPGFSKSQVENGKIVDGIYRDELDTSRTACLSCQGGTKNLGTGFDNAPGILEICS